MSKPRQDKPRHSLQPQSSQPNHTPFRHTKSQNYDKRGGSTRKKLTSSIPTIHEVENEVAGVETVQHEVVNEKPMKKGSMRKSQSERKSSGYDNAGFSGSTGNLTAREQFQRRSTTQQSFTSTSSIKDPSVRSLPVIREQYCCCSRWSACEKILISIVAVLAVVIIALVIAVSYMASEKGGIGTAFHWSL